LGGYATSTNLLHASTRLVAPYVAVVIVLAIVALALFGGIFYFSYKIGIRNTLKIVMFSAGFCWVFFWAAHHVLEKTINASTFIPSPADDIINCCLTLTFAGIALEAGWHRVIKERVRVFKIRYMLSCRRDDGDEIGNMASPYDNLQGLLEDVPERSVREALFDRGDSLTHGNIYHDYEERRLVTTIELEDAVTRNLNAVRANRILELPEGYQEILRLYTTEHPRIYAALNRPFKSRDRTIPSFYYQRSMAALMIRALRAYIAIPTVGQIEEYPCIQNCTLYRAFVVPDTDLEMIIQFDHPETGFRNNRPYTFATFSSMSTSRSVALTKFGRGGQRNILFVIHGVMGANMRLISEYVDENEVLPIPPIIFTVQGYRIDHRLEQEAGYGRWIEVTLRAMRCKNYTTSSHPWVIS
jgi:hypothetical protein